VFQLLNAPLLSIRACYPESVLATIQVERTKKKLVAASWTSLGTIALAANPVKADRLM
jgi:hypothetical protein